MRIFAFHATAALGVLQNNQDSCSLHAAEVENAPTFNPWGPGNMADKGTKQTWRHTFKCLRQATPVEMWGKNLVPGGALAPSHY